MLISLIAAIDEAYGIGKNNQLLCHLPADLQHFKHLTLHKTIIMGRKTFESIGKALPYRQNIVLSTQDLKITDAEVVPSLKQALAQAKHSKHVVIIGGHQVFLEGLAIADELYLTHIHHHFDADTFFPKITWSQWHCVHKVFRARDLRNPFDMTFAHYQKNIKKGYLSS